MWKWFFFGMDKKYHKRVVMSPQDESAKCNLEEDIGIFNNTGIQQVQHNQLILTVKEL